MLIKYCGYGSIFSVKDGRSIDIGQCGFLYSGVFSLTSADANNLTIKDELEIGCIQPIEHPNAPAIIPMEYRNKDFLFSFSSERGNWSSQMTISKNPFLAKCSISTNKLEFLNAIPEEIAQQIVGKKYTTPGLLALVEASEKFWGNAEPDDKETHPISKNVEDWLRSEKDFSGGGARQGATLIRPLWGADGRRPNKKNK